MNKGIGDNMRAVTIRIRQVLVSSQFAIIVGILMCISMATYTLWYSSAGNFPDFPKTENDYVDLAEAFLQGQFALLEKPSSAFMALQDPYDLTQRNVPYRWDASYYEGQYYLYWGPVPALAFAAIEAIIHLRPLGSLLVIICYIGLSVLLLIILFQIWQRFFPMAPGFSIGLCLLTSLINLPMLFLLGRPTVYETSVIAGQTFLFAGLLCWIVYTTGTGKNGWLLAASLNWGLAIGSRYNLAISIAVYLVFALTWIIREAKAPALIGKRFALLLMPLALCLIGLGLYNFARFGNPFETGHIYQLGIPGTQSERYSLSYVLSNLFVYLFYPMTTIRFFPFILSTLPLESRFDEVVAGLLPSNPSSWLLGLMIPCLLSRAFLGARRRESVHTSVAPLFSMIMIAALMQLLFLTTFFVVTMRYMVDFCLQLALGIWILVWQADKIVQTRAPLRVILWLVVVGLVFWTAGIGLFGSLDIPPQTFRISNPLLYGQLESYWNNQYTEIVSLFRMLGIFNVD